jgi:hypothetical protein
MGIGKKTDSKNLLLKVELRRKVIAEMGLSPLSVLDLFAGKGIVWTEMRKYFEVAKYVPLDKNPRMPGTIRVDDSARYIPGFDLQAFNVVDVDPYGECWPSWDVFTQLIAKPTAVFLTNGTMVATRSHYVMRHLGIPTEWDVPKRVEISQFAPLFFLTPERNRCRIVKAYRCSMEHIAYYGLICEPI